MISHNKGICLSPFDNLHVKDHAYSTCCPFWVRDGKTGWTNESPWKVWNHPAFVELRRDVLSGEFKQCTNCVIWLEGLPEGPWPMRCQPVMQTGPRQITLANDNTCNLHCWSCRSQVQGNVDVAARKEIQDRILAEFLPTAKRLSVSHSGDPFASPMHRELLLDLAGNNDKLGDLEIELFTNGLLLPKYWPQLKNIHGRVTRVLMSIDAATPSTYERTRRGGHWKDVLITLELLSRLPLKHFAINMVVQADNFCEIGDFIRLGLQYGVTNINFSMLRQWPHLTRRQYEGQSLANPMHPQHGEFLNVLEKNKELLELPQVHASKLQEKGRALIQRLYHPKTLVNCKDIGLNDFIDKQK